MNKKIIKISAFWIFSLICASCNKEHKIRQLLKEWNNKEFLFNDRICDIISSQESNNITRDADSTYILVYYIDKEVCSSCRLNSWKEYIGELSVLSGGRVKTLLILSPDAAEQIQENLAEFDSNLAYYIDTKDELKNKNDLPQNDLFRMMLLNTDHKVVAIGNSLINGNVRCLFLKIITGKEEETMALSALSIDNTSLDFGKIQQGVPMTKECNITNIGLNTIFIKRLSTSCNCLSLKMRTNIIQPGETIPISLTLSPIENGNVNEVAFISCNDEKSPLTIKVKGFSE